MAGHMSEVQIILPGYVVDAKFLKVPELPVILIPWSVFMDTRSHLDVMYVFFSYLAIIRDRMRHANNYWMGS